MQKGNSYTVGQWCDRWFCENQGCILRRPAVAGAVASGS